MTDFLDGDAIIFMKVGTHASEDLGDIIKRKRREIDDAGFAMWGYGGNTCHPTTMVRPFAVAQEKQGHVIRLCMQPMQSHHFAEQVRADEYSEDGLTWNPVPKGINVLGSRYALCIRNLEPAEMKLRLSDTVVALGNSRGKPGSDYVRGRVDKACLQVQHGMGAGVDLDIGLVAELVSPYAVLLRNSD